MIEIINKNKNGHIQIEMKYVNTHNCVVSFSLQQDEETKAISSFSMTRQNHTILDTVEPKDKEWYIQTVNTYCKNLENKFNHAKEVINNTSNIKDKLNAGTTIESKWIDDFPKAYYIFKKGVRGSSARLEKDAYKTAYMQQLMEF